MRRAVEGLLRTLTLALMPLIVLAALFVLGWVLWQTFVVGL